MKNIILKNGEKAIVDDKYYEFLSQWKWHCANGYAVRQKKSKENKWRQLKMHTVIMGVKEGLEVDHINNIRLDNRRDNLRFATRSQNVINTKGGRDNRTGHRGVCVDCYIGKHTKTLRIRAYISVDGVVKWLGKFNTIRDAAIAYNEAAKIYRGDFAKLNNIVGEGN